VWRRKENKKGERESCPWVLSSGQMSIKIGLSDALSLQIPSLRGGG
jgi:hypothetical protein